jgi:hypothetical protein
VDWFVGEGEGEGEGEDEGEGEVGTKREANGLSLEKVMHVSLSCSSCSSCSSCQFDSFGSSCASRSLFMKWASNWKRPWMSTGQGHERSRSTNGVVPDEVATTIHYWPTTDRILFAMDARNMIRVSIARNQHPSHVNKASLSIRVSRLCYVRARVREGGGEGVRFCISKAVRPFVRASKGASEDRSLYLYDGLQNFMRM